jgi:hypothetical protein
MLVAIHALNHIEARQIPFQFVIALDFYELAKPQTALSSPAGIQNVLRTKRKPPLDHLRKCHPTRYKRLALKGLDRLIKFLPIYSGYRRYMCFFVTGNKDVI